MKLPAEVAGPWCASLRFYSAGDSLAAVQHSVITLQRLQVFADLSLQQLRPKNNKKVQNKKLALPKPSSNDFQGLIDAAFVVCFNIACLLLVKFNDCAGAFAFVQLAFQLRPCLMARLLASTTASKLTSHLASWIIHIFILLSISLEEPVKWVTARYLDVAVNFSTANSDVESTLALTLFSGLINSHDDERYLHKALDVLSKEKSKLVQDVDRRQTLCALFAALIASSKDLRLSNGELDDLEIDDCGHDCSFYYACLLNAVGVNHLLLKPNAKTCQAIKLFDQAFKSLKRNHQSNSDLFAGVTTNLAVSYRLLLGLNNGGTSGNNLPLDLARKSIKLSQVASSVQLLCRFNLLCEQFFLGQDNSRSLVQFLQFLTVDAANDTVLQRGPLVVDALSIVASLQARCDQPVEAKTNFDGALAYARLLAGRNGEGSQRFWRIRNAISATVFYQPPDSLNKESSGSPNSQSSDNDDEQQVTNVMAASAIYYMRTPEVDQPVAIVPQANTTCSLFQCFRRSKIWSSKIDKAATTQL